MRLIWSIMIILLVLDFSKEYFNQILSTCFYRYLVGIPKSHANLVINKQISIWLLGIPTRYPTRYLSKLNKTNSENMHLPCIRYYIGISLTLSLLLDEVLNFVLI